MLSYSNRLDQPSLLPEIQMSNYQIIKLSMIGDWSMIGQILVMIGDC